MSTTKLKRIATIALLLIAPSAFAVSIEHNAKTWFCPAVPSFHGECESILTNNTVGIDNIVFWCYLERNYVQVDEEIAVHNFSGNNTTSDVMSVIALNNKWHCTYNISLYRDGNDVYPNQEGDSDCKTYRASGPPP